MNVISFRRIREFNLLHRDAGNALKAWYTVVKRSGWQNLAELKQTYPSADLVDRYTVFNIKGNKYRLVSRIVYRSQTVFIVAILTHKEYDLGKWKNE
jgi:mRNA interferase HigB